jgi:hypothetical protein
MKKLDLYPGKGRETRPAPVAPARTVTSAPLERAVEPVRYSHPERSLEIMRAAVAAIGGDADEVTA